MPVSLENYCIPVEYTPRLDNAAFDDTPFKDEWQKSVYAHAAWLCASEDWRSVLDLGCGSGFKLIKYFSHLDTLGLDLPPTVDFCRRTYPQRAWAVLNFGQPVTFNADLVIAADVIEHLPNPDQLLAYIEQMYPKAVVLSTPARERLGLTPEEQMGPPKNRHHVREWTSPEFAAYIGQRFEILEHHVGPQGDPQAQFIVARLK